jgi:hypothetical protein
MSVEDERLLQKSFEIAQMLGFNHRQLSPEDLRRVAIVELKLFTPGYILGVHRDSQGMYSIIDPDGNLVAFGMPVVNICFFFHYF